MEKYLQKPKFYFIVCTYIKIIIQQSSDIYTRHVIQVKPLNAKSDMLHYVHVVGGYVQYMYIYSMFKYTVIGQMYCTFVAKINMYNLWVQWVLSCYERCNSVMSYRPSGIILDLFTLRIKHCYGSMWVKIGN